MPETISVILSEPRPGDTQQQELVDFLSRALASRKSIGLTSVPHLYDLDPAGPTMEFLRRLDGPMIVISWLHPRAAYWTLRTGGVEGRLADPSDTADRESVRCGASACTPGSIRSRSLTRSTGLPPPTLPQTGRRSPTTAREASHRRGFLTAAGAVRPVLLRFPKRLVASGKTPASAGTR